MRECRKCILIVNYPFIVLYVNPRTHHKEFFKINPLVLSTFNTYSSLQLRSEVSDLPPFLTLQSSWENYISSLYTWINNSLLPKEWTGKYCPEILNRSLITFFLFDESQLLPEFTLAIFVEPISFKFKKETKNLTSKEPANHQDDVYTQSYRWSFFIFR